MNLNPALDDVIYVSGAFQYWICKNIDCHNENDFNGVEECFYCKTKKGQLKQTLPPAIQTTQLNPQPVASN